MSIKKNIRINCNQGYYFPLFNRLGLRSAITPYLQGDLKLDQHHYALSPISELDLYHLSTSRNVIFHIDGKPYHLNGSRIEQQDDNLIYNVDLLYQNIKRVNFLYQMEVTSFVADDALIECHEVIYTNKTDKVQKVKATVAIPLYGRSADNIRDHRHVTSLLNRIMTHEFSVELKPTLLFNEKGHFENHTSYAVLAMSSDMTISGFIPTVEDYINGGSFEYPKGFDHLTEKHQEIDGYECMGAIQFEEISVCPNESIKLYMGIAIEPQSFDENKYQTYLNEEGFHKALETVNLKFKKYLDLFEFNIENQVTTTQLKWIALQPLLRRYYGNSFLPHHDYGHGGKGWRDIWQDLLGMIMTGDPQVLALLFDNFAGVRIDGSNATIIGDKPGEFIADRNSITRIWSDHGVWPLITVKMYLDETNDLDFLLRKQSYFFDQFTHYTHQVRNDKEKNTGYKGTILEHLLLQNLVAFHHRGLHGYVKLEDADWNDGLDMAKAKGETIAFTHMYVNNLRIIKELITAIPVNEFEFFSAINQLLELDANIEVFFDEVSKFDAKTIKVAKTTLIKKLEDLIQPMISFIQANAFNYDRYEAYYNEQGELLDQQNTVNLTGQAMALLSNIATKEQAKMISIKTKDVLFDEKIGGYHLNSKYQSLMGRAFQFAYNHKENGAIFSHMAVMYAYGLYQYDLVDKAREAVFSLLHQAQKETSGVLVGIPEYFTEKGIGKYNYLTGSASWILKLMRTEIFGLNFNLGTLILKPKLTKSDFINGKASIQTVVFGKLIKIIYYNKKQLEYGNYHIIDIEVNHEHHENKFNEVQGDIEVFLDEII
ncbi:MAG: hypothetical protein WCR19_05650 [Acholeplasmataceae bacterium]